MGIEITDAGAGEARSRIVLQDHHLNYNDVAHGGVVSGLIDSAAGAAVRTVRTLNEITERPHATSDLHVQYLAGARGTELRAHGRVVKAGRTALFVDVWVTDDADRPVARGSVTFVVSGRRA
jgi:uncharacterized protein (TIGR00369 family)